MKYTLYIIKMILFIMFFSFLLTVGNYYVYSGEVTTDDTKSKLSGAELWAQNCNRCHNMRAPQEFNDSQWSIILAHMRVIGNIPGDQAEQILKFLQESNNPPMKSTMKMQKTSVKTASTGNIKNGKKHFKGSCSACHGLSGEGDGAAAASLTPKPKNLKDKNYMGNLTDDYLFNIIKYGGTSVNKSQFMPAWGSTLSDQDINDVISYIRSL